MSGPLRVMIIGDSESDTRELLRELRHHGYAPEYERVETAEEMQAALKGRDWDVVLSGHSLAHFTCAGALRVLQEAQLDLPLIVVSDEIGGEAAVAALRAGAHDFVRKDNLGRLGPAIARGLSEARGQLAGRREEAGGPGRKAQLRQVESVEALARLSGAVAHDFNNLLTAILGGTELLQGELRSELPEDDPVMLALEQLDHAGQRAAKLTRQLLTFSRCEPTKLEVIDPDAILRDMAPALRRLSGENISFEMDLSPGVRKIRADIDALEQLVTNLVVNACEAMPDGGRLVVTTENVLLSEEDAARLADACPGWHTILTVRDTGRGMAPETLERIFEPFFSKKVSGKGTGLGLTIVRRIVAHLHGHVRVDSEPERGTTFRVCFPAVEETVRQTAG